MVQFNELRINSDGTKLIIDVSVEDLQYYQDVYLDNISIDTQDTFVGDNPSDKVIYSYNLDGDNKSVKLEIREESLPALLQDNMFFVWVKVKGSPSLDTPCGMDLIYSVGVTLYLCPLYNTMMQYVTEVEKECKVPKNFINLFLQYKALEVSISTKNYMKSIDYYNKFFKNIRAVSNKSANCGCYG